MIICVAPIFVVQVSIKISTIIEDSLTLKHIEKITCIALIIIDRIGNFKTLVLLKHLNMIICVAPIFVVQVRIALSKLWFPHYIIGLPHIEPPG